MEFFGRVSDAFFGASVKPVDVKPVSLVERAAAQKKKGKLYLNGTTVIDLKNTVGAKKGLFVCAPLRKDGSEYLRQCYRKLFQVALINQAKILLIPAFSTGEGGYPHQEAASIAIEEASQFIQDNPGIEIVFNAYDQQNVEAYDKAFEDFLKNAPELSAKTSSRLAYCKGKIQEIHADMVVIPVGSDFQNPGAVYKEIEKIYASKITTTPIEEGWRAFIEGGNQLPHCLPLLDTQDISKLILIDRQTTSTVLRQLELRKWAPKYFDNLGLFDKGESHFYGSQISIFFSETGVLTWRLPYLNEYGKEENLLFSIYASRDNAKSDLTNLKADQKNWFYTSLYLCEPNRYDYNPTSLTTNLTAEQKRWINSTPASSEAVRYVPIKLTADQKKWIKTAETVKNFPTMVVVGKRKHHVKLQCLNVNRDLAKHPHIFDRYCTDQEYAKQINLAVTFDASGDDAVVSDSEIRALQAAIISEPAQYADSVFLYTKLSPIQIVTMQVLKVFSIPAFLSAYKEEQDLTSADCPFHLWSEEKDAEIKDEAAVNAVLKIKINATDHVREISEQSPQKLLLSCNLRFECKDVVLENGIVVVSLETTNKEEGLLPAGFDMWSFDRDLMAHTSETAPTFLYENFKKAIQSSSLPSKKPVDGGA